ncbi:hypothetical protein ID866_8318 [Astraeus odoratus]|nr:hypothetical protein ID866_8318 [Astraeus odoratus]
MTTDTPPADANDVFSLSDQLLAERLHFVKEIGFGNWGSVWLCRPKASSGKQKDVEVAVKLVHRSKTPTTAARVRSLWNEMKIVRSFKHDPHPSIIPFHSFIITPSYALITMAYLPTLVPVEVSEPRAKEWFRSLLSGVHFLHSRGVVHNDIKPANILLSPANVPVLVDFGFAEKYDMTSPKAFHSNLAYGTPEYLSPERARGMPHDTRKSDVWSLGVTFFEILVGRTPFEYEEGEVFEKKEDLERYWERTMRGKWVGSYTMSKTAEHFLRRMIVPNADLRCTAADLMQDAFWEGQSASVTNGKAAHKKSASAALPNTRTLLRSPSFFSPSKDKVKEKEKDTSMSRLLDISLPWSGLKSASRSSVARSASRTESVPRSASRTDTLPRSGTPSSTTHSRVQTPNSDAVEALNHATRPSGAHGRSHALHSRSKSQPRLRSPSGAVSRGQQVSGGKRRLSPVQASPVVKALKAIDSDGGNGQLGKENGRPGLDSMASEDVGATPSPKLTSLRSVSSLRRPLGPRQPSPRTADQNGSSARSKETEQSVSPAHAALFPPTPATPQTSGTVQTSATKQLSGKPARTRSRARVLADLTGFARNVDLRAHGVGIGMGADTSRPGRVKGVRPRDDGARTKGGAVDSHVSGRAATKNDEDKENASTPRVVSPPRGPRRPARLPGDKDKENTRALPFATPEMQYQSQSESQSHSQSMFQPQAKSTPKDHDASATSATLSVLANLSTATNTTKGSVRDRMLDWQKLREMNRASTVLSGSCSSSSSASTLTSEDESDDQSDSDSDSEVEAEVAAEAHAAAAVRNPYSAETEVEPKKELLPQTELARTRSVQTTHTTTTAVSTTSGLAASTLTGGSAGHGEKGEIEIAKLAVRASAQILASRNGSLSAIALNQTMSHKHVQEEEVQRPEVKAVDDNGLPTEVHRTSESALSGLKHSVKASIDKGVRLYKSSTLAQFTARTTPVWCPSPEPVPLDFESRRSGEGRFSWENIRPEEEIALDRMNMWIQSVEKVVEETRQNFASTSVTQPTALPLVPVSRSSSQNNHLRNSQNTNYNTTRSSSRLPRRHLPANQIFAELTNPDAPLSPASKDRSMSFSYVDVPESSCPVLPTLSVLAQTPPRKRRATILTRSPAQEKKAGDESDALSPSPSRQREKSRSYGNLDRHIRDVAKLELELNMDTVSKPATQRLSAVLDRSLFVASPVSPKFSGDVTDDLTASPCHVEPYPVRRPGEQNVPSSPERRRLEGVYDRFLMATTGVKRVGKGYQSENFKPLQNATAPDTSNKSSSAHHPRTFGVFGSTKRQMPPPVSSDDIWRRSTSIDELGFNACGAGMTSPTPRASREDSKNTAALVKRAIKAIVPGKTVSRRLSRTLIT